MQHGYNQNVIVHFGREGSPWHTASGMMLLDHTDYIRQFWNYT